MSNVGDCRTAPATPGLLNIITILHIVNKPGVAAAVLQTPLSLIESVSDPFPPNLQNIITPKP